MERTAIEIVKRLREKGYQAYFAGGYVRDKLLHRVSTGDIDIATNAMPKEVLKLFSNSKYIGEAFGVVQVREGDYSFEIATFRKDVGAMDGRHPCTVLYTDDIKKDAQRRDFTINAMYYDPIEDKVLDFVNGQEDLKLGVINFVGDPAKRIREDYLRMLRAVRFVARFGFTFHWTTFDYILADSDKILKIAPERIFQELKEIFTTADVGDAFLELAQTGLLDHLFPEIKQLENVQEPKEFHPEGTTYAHIEKVIQNIPFGSPLCLTYAALFHDLGKIKTKGFHKGRITYYGHDKVSAEMVGDILKRYRADNKLIEDVTWLVGHHMAFKNIPHMKKSTLKRFIANPLFYELLQLHYADVMGSNKKLDNYNYLIRKLSEINIEEVKKEVTEKRILTGYDLKNYTTIEPGPIYKTILDDVHERFLNGELHNRHEALQYISKYIYRQLGE